MHRRYFLGIATAALAAASTRGLAAGVRDVLFVHGRGEGGFDPAVIEKQWMDAFRQGAQKLGRAVPQALKVAFPYYGDKLDAFTNAASLPVTADIRTRGAAPDKEFLEFQSDVVEDLRTRAGVTDAEIRKVQGPNPQERGPLNWQWVLAVLRALDNHLGSVSQGAIEEFTRDVYLYLTKSVVRDTIDGIVRDKLTERPTIVVAHSLGSVVAYNVLRSDRRRLNVPLLVTVGCPLGIRAVHAPLVPLTFPKPVKAWYNAFDLSDVVALDPLDADNFPVTPPVTNYSGVHNHTDNRHAIDGYLDDPNVAAHLLDGLVA
jgi:hypothetical protein